jgi:hypothetical protein
MINKNIVRSMLLEEFDRAESFSKVLKVLKSVQTKDQYNTAIQYANNYIKSSKTNPKNKDWQTINKILTFLKIKVKLNKK